MNFGFAPRPTRTPPPNRALLRSIEQFEISGADPDPQIKPGPLLPQRKQFSMRGEEFFQTKTPPTSLRVTVSEFKIDADPSLYIVPSRIVRSGPAPTRSTPRSSIAAGGES
jgi:hypothetical protein